MRLMTPPRARPQRAKARDYRTPRHVPITYGEYNSGTVYALISIPAPSHARDARGRGSAVHPLHPSQVPPDVTSPWGVGHLRRLQRGKELPMRLMPKVRDTTEMPWTRAEVVPR